MDAHKNTSQSKNILSQKGDENMTKKEREQMHDKLTLQMMENVNRHAAVQEMIQEEEKEGSDMVKLTVAFCAGCLVTVGAASMLLTMI